MAELSVQVVTTAGKVVAFTAANSGGDTFQNSGKERVRFKTGATEAAKTVTIVAVGPCSHGSLHNLTVNVPASGGEIEVANLDTGRFGTTVSMTYSAVTNLSVAVTSQ